MKKSIIIPLLLFTMFAFAQTNEITFEIKNGNIEHKPSDLTKLKLPLKINFSKDFNGKELLLKNNIDKQKINETQIFGQDEMTFHANDPFVYEFRDGKTIPGDNNIPSQEILLSIGGKDFVLNLLDEEPKPRDAELSDDDKSYKAGYVYYDAMKLSDSKTSYDLKKSILESYKVDLVNRDKNPYLNDALSSFYAEKKDRDKKGGVQAGLNIPFLSNLGNTDVTYFAAGLARFLAERTKEELNEAFFSKMKEQLNEYPELMTVFPKTSSFLNIIETYSYASVIQVLKEAFETDIQNLPENLYNVKSLTDANCNSSILKNRKLADCQDRLKKLKAYFESQEGRWIGLGMFTVKEAIQSSNPADLLKSITESTEFTGIKKFATDNSKYADYNVATSIELSNFLSQSLLSKDDNQIWINSKELNALFKDKDQRRIKIYLGLLLAMEQKGDVKIDFYKSDNTLITFGAILKEAYKTYTVLEPQISSLIKNTHTAFSSANNAIRKMIAATEKSVEADPQALYDYYRTFTASLKPIAHNELLSSITGRKDIGTKYELIEQYLNPSVDIAYHIATKKYSAAIYDATILLSYLKPVDDKFKPMTKSFVKYGTLISTVANAQSSDEVKQALDASVLPVGSSAIKRKSAWSISVNGYVGGFYGQAHSTIQDTLRNTSTNQLDTISKPISYRTFGLYAPIGLSFNRGFKSGWGITLHAQILDLGALVNFYLTEGDKASLPTDFKVKLSDILSPGIQLGINIPKTPLSIMGGMQYVPALNNSSQISTSQLSPIAWRAQIGIVVDIPLYNLKVWDFKK